MTGENSLFGQYPNRGPSFDVREACRRLLRTPFHRLVHEYRTRLSRRHWFTPSGALHGVFADSSSLTVSQLVRSSPRRTRKNAFLKARLAKTELHKRLSTRMPDCVATPQTQRVSRLEAHAHSYFCSTQRQLAMRTLDNKFRQNPHSSSFSIAGRSETANSSSARFAIATAAYS
jgi:hypothetical protein